MISESKGAVHYRATAVDLCLIALTQGPLIRNGRQWRFGRRYFSNATVRRLLDEGAAVLIGDTVRSAQASIGAIGAGGPAAREASRASCLTVRVPNVKRPAPGIIGARRMADDLVLACIPIPKSQREELKVALGYLKGEPMVALSVHRRTDRGNMVRTGKALSVRPAVLPELIRALQAAEASLAGR